MESWYWYVLAGLICGVFSATFGVGSGIIMIPVLVLVFSLPQKSAQGTCLAVMVPMALAGALRYQWNPQIHLDVGMIGLLSLGAVVGAVFGAGLAGWLPGSVLRKLFAVIMIAVALRMLTTTPAANTPNRQANAPPAACPSQTDDLDDREEA